MEKYREDESTGETPLVAWTSDTGFSLWRGVAGNSLYVPYNDSIGKNNDENTRKTERTIDVCRCRSDAGKHGSDGIQRGAVDDNVRRKCCGGRRHSNVPEGEGTG